MGTGPHATPLSQAPLGTQSSKPGRTQASLRDWGQQAEGAPCCSLASPLLPPPQDHPSRSHQPTFAESQARPRLQPQPVLSFSLRWLSKCRGKGGYKGRGHKEGMSRRAPTAQAIVGTGAPAGSPAPQAAPHPTRTCKASSSHTRSWLRPGKFLTWPGAELARWPPGRGPYTWPGPAQTHPVGEECGPRLPPARAGLGKLPPRWFPPALTQPGWARSCSLSKSSLPGPRPPTGEGSRGQA